MGHWFGKWSFKEYGDKILNQINDSCGFAIGHGYMEEAGSELSGKEYYSLFKDYCNKSNKVSSCVHGFGHGLYLTKSNFKFADQVCKDINDFYKVEDINHPHANNILCMEGFVMESFLGEINYWKKGDVEFSDVVKRCEEMNQYSKIGCLGISIRNYVTVANTFDELKNKFGGRKKEMLDYCKLKTGEELFYCSGYIGYTLSESLDLKNLGSINDKEIVKFCSEVDSTPCYDSYFGAIHSLFNNNNEILNNYCEKFDQYAEKICRNNAQ